MRINWSKCKEQKEENLDWRDFREKDESVHRRSPPFSTSLLYILGKSGKIKSKSLLDESQNACASCRKRERERESKYY